MIRRAMILVLAMGAEPVFASPTPLPEEAHINEQLIAAQAGDILRKTCPTIEARMFVVWDKAYMLRQYAIEQGYDEEGVKAFLNDPVQKARVLKAAQDYLAKAGAKPGDVASYCAAGKAEIAKQTLLGQIIRSTE
jgi:major membrane immunogen (membrane-anchored lipoprotein)